LGYECFVCKRERSIARIVKEGRTRQGRRWFLCESCSKAYAEQVQSELKSKIWDANAGLCPRCEEPDLNDDDGFPLRTRWCDACGFRYTLMLASPEEREAHEALDDEWLEHVQEGALRCEDAPSARHGRESSARPPEP